MDKKADWTSRGVDAMEDQMWPMFGTLVDERLFSLIAHESATFHATHEPLWNEDTIKKMLECRGDIMLYVCLTNQAQAL